jgi:uncharacterized membrane protein YphA (DoxX/SURF4 family)
VGRFFVGFPDGMPGIALLILRVVFGLATVLEGYFYLTQPNPTLACSLAGLIALAIGGLLALGFLTPIVAMLLLLGRVAIAASLMPASMPNLFDSKTALIFSIAILLSLLGLGPGAFSVDARLYGRREIIIRRPADK